MYVPAGGSVSLLEGVCSFVKGGMSPGFLVLRFQKPTPDPVFLSSVWGPRYKLSATALVPCLPTATLPAMMFMN